MRFPKKSKNWRASCLLILLVSQSSWAQTPTTEAGGDAGSLPAGAVLLRRGQPAPADGIWLSTPRAAQLEAARQLVAKRIQLEVRTATRTEAEQWKERVAVTISERDSALRELADEKRGRERDVEDAARRLAAAVPVWYERPWVVSGATAVILTALFAVLSR